MGFTTHCMESVKVVHSWGAVPASSSYQTRHWTISDAFWVAAQLLPFFSELGGRGEGVASFAGPVFLIARITLLRIIVACRADEAKTN